MTHPLNEKLNVVELEKANNQTAIDFVSNVALLMANQGLTDINFWKKCVTTPDGGVYLLQLIHVDGPKIQLKAIYPEMAEARPVAVPAEKKKRKSKKEIKPVEIATDAIQKDSV